MFNNYLSFQLKSNYLSLFALFDIHAATRKDGKIDCMSIITRFGLLAGIRWSVGISQSQRILCLILVDGFWFMHEPFGCKIEFHLLAQFSLDHAKTYTSFVLVYYIHLICD